MQSRVNNFKRFYARENERALFGFFTQSEYPLLRYPRLAERLPTQRELRPGDFDLNAFAADCESLFAAHEACGGDFIFAGSAFWGIPWSEVLSGFPIKVGAAGAIELAGAKIGETRFDPTGEWAILAKAMIGKLVECSRGKYPLAATRTRGVVDLLQAELGAEELVYALIDEPEWIIAKAKSYARLIADFWKFQLSLIPEWFGGIGSFYYHVWAPKGTCWHQEDAASVLSPELFEKYILPYDRWLIAENEHLILHQHPSSALPLAQNMGAGYLALELHVDAGSSSAAELHDTHFKILSEKPLIVWGELTSDDLRALRALPQKGLAIQAVVRNSDDARAMTEEWNSL